MSGMTRGGFLRRRRAVGVDTSAMKARDVLQRASEHPEELDALLAGEQAGKARRSVIDGLADLIAAREEPAGDEPVTDAPVAE